MTLIDGNAIAQEVLAEVKQRAAALAAGTGAGDGDAAGVVPHAVFVRVGDDPASVSYVAKKQRVAAECGMRSTLVLFPENVSRDELLARLDALNADPAVHGILVQAPLPRHLDETEVFNRISPAKDVDGFTSLNVGRLVQEQPGAFAPCTPAGIVELLRRSGVVTAGKRVVVVGRSLIVGKPAALLLLARGADATVTVCHSRTADLGVVTREADILVAAIGKPRLITADMVKEGAVVIDVGINRVPDPSRKSGHRLVGDVDFDAVAPKCSLITPVPGGVGPMTVAMLMRNTVAAAERAAI